MSRKVVVKIGGSLLRSGTAIPLLRALRERAKERLAIVPGGGAFADAVRAAQTEHHLSDAAAHHMALIAMDLSARMVVDKAEGFVVAGTDEQFDSAWSHLAIPVWAPARMASADSRMPQSWDMTSDSLGAWLAIHLTAANLVVVKSCAIPESIRDDASALAAAGIVDACFPEAVRARRFRWSVVSGIDAALGAIGMDG